MPQKINQKSYVLMPKINGIFMACRERRVLLLQVFKSSKNYSINLFGAWEVGAPKVGAPSSHAMSLSPLFIGDTPNRFLLRFLAKIREKRCGKYKKNSIKILRKKKRKFEWQSLKEGW